MVLEGGREAGLEPRQSRSGTRVKGGKFKEMNGEGTGIANNFSAYPPTYFPIYRWSRAAQCRLGTRACRFLNVGFMGEFSASSAWPRAYFWISIRDETKRGETRRGEERRGETRAASGRRAGIHSYRGNFARTDFRVPNSVN